VCGSFDRFYFHLAGSLQRFFLQADLPHIMLDALLVIATMHSTNQGF
jgi:hypothetical protein